MHFPLLQDLLLLFVSSVIVVLIFQRLKLPAVIGFLVTGIIIGPHALSLVKASEEVEMMSEIGVILLLFVIGMEMSLKQLAAIQKTVILGGAVQVGLTILVTALCLLILGMSWNSSVFIGFLFSLSSTAIVLKIFQDRNEIFSPQGRIALGILIFQDLIVVPMMLFTPILAGNSENIGMSILLLLAKSAGVILITLFLARVLIPRLFNLVVKTRNQELFLLTTITLCFAVAFLTAEAGLSLALGAFLAGLIISESPYSHQATGMILPFRELFTSIFFISIGMLLDISFFIQNIFIILPVALIVFAAKGTIAGIAAYVLKYPLRTCILAGISLFQIGEFAFILSREGLANNLMSDEVYQYFLAISILTMAMTPFAINYSEKISLWLTRSKISQRVNRPVITSETPESLKKDHLIIIGYGINGRNVARAARHANIPYMILELNADTVRKERASGENIMFGDAVHPHILHELHAENARVIVIAISDPQATKSIVSNVRQICRTTHVIVRTRFVNEIDDLLQLGADEVIPEEFETSIEIFSRVMHKYLVPMNEVQILTESIRNDNYQFLSPHHKKPEKLTSTAEALLNIECVRVISDHGPVVGKSIAAAQIRNKFKVNILGISRDEEMISNIISDEVIKQHDLIYLSGEPKDIENFYRAVSE